ncbi:Rossmann fold nucleotide-binding protein Smf possibly involved in DNA uptake [Patulibacter medicamentivorans]|uniref:Rossmann fold nucleotide-binding protein Smf possibly involved in DNA uptake n=1 Tax=Patulibacter medicamentivorans TaxID=1097667 RepID=H0E3H9_9ACTN|nr:DNA-processing protein DprA [Patulibacter medicamentivorans]EHN11776.1 Rossmann fold nucleotide-binding protein Smf possibly involved in DNA uptake [Patulibacter medicamentivorans]
MSACAACLRRTGLLAELSPVVEERFRRDRPAGLLALDDRALVAELCRRDGPDAAALRTPRRSDDDLLSAAAENARRHRIVAICRHDDAYPSRLLDLRDPPAVLHVLDGPQRLAQTLGGDPRRPTVAIVGARRAPDEGRSFARQLGEQLAGAGVTVVSGMAFGVDAAAHDGALRAAPGAHRNTVAVLAGGIERAHPARLRPLYERIVDRGAVVGEMPPGATPRRWAFPARNRLIAALADVVVVVAAAERSGSLITVDLAGDLDRAIGTVPGSVLDPRHRGSNALLRASAHPILDAQDVITLLGTALPGRSAAALPAIDPLGGLDGAARRLAEALLPGPRTPEQLLSTVERADGAVAERDLLLGLAQLEAAGRLRRSLDGSLALLPAPLAGSPGATGGR